MQRAIRAAAESLTQDDTHCRGVGSNARKTAWVGPRAPAQQRAAFGFFRTYVAWHKYTFLVGR